MFCFCGRKMEGNTSGDCLVGKTFDSKGKLIAWTCIHGESWKDNIPRALERDSINLKNNKLGGTHELG